MPLCRSSMSPLPSHLRGVGSRLTKKITKVSCLGGGSEMILKVDTYVYVCITHTRALIG